MATLRAQPKKKIITTNQKATNPAQISNGRTTTHQDKVSKAVNLIINKITDTTIASHNMIIFSSYYDYYSLLNRF